MRTLEQGVLATALPAAIASLERGAIVVPLSGRLLTPLYQQERLRRLLVLPPDSEPAEVRRWLQIVKDWRFNWGAMETAGRGRND